MITTATKLIDDPIDTCTGSVVNGTDSLALGTGIGRVGLGVVVVGGVAKAKRKYPTVRMLSPLLRAHKAMCIIGHTLLYCPTVSMRIMRKDNDKKMQNSLL